MVIEMKLKNNQAKTTEFIHYDTKEKLFGGVCSEYGYNFDNNIDKESIMETQVYRPKKDVNRDFFYLKR